MLGLTFFAGLLLSLVTANQSATANVLFDTQATLSWAPAPGTVVDYGVWVFPTGSTPPTSAASPTLRVPTTTTTIAGQYGSGVQIVVAAFYPGDEIGPFSATSETIYFRAPIPAPYDFNGDGRADRTLRDDATGRLRISLVDGAAVVPSVDLLADNPRQLRVAGSADFDGDGKADLLMWGWKTGAAELWLLDGDQVRAKLPIATMGRGWSAHAIGDIDADGTARILWHDRNTGTSQLWSMRIDQVVAQRPMLPMASNWEVWGNCDVDGNGSRDLLWIDYRANAARLWMLDAGADADEVGLAHPGDNFEFGGCGDFNRDGADTLVWQNRKNLEFWSFNQIDASTATATGDTRFASASSPGRLSQIGDFDADGDADLARSRKTRSAVDTQLLEADQVTAQGSSPIEVSGRWVVSSW
jgi:hypothetical protein